METETTMKNLNSSKTPEQQDKKGVSTKALATLIGGALLFWVWACSNNKDPYLSEVEQGILTEQKLQKEINTQNHKIHKKGRKIANLEGTRKSLAKAYEEVAEKYEQKRAECIFLRENNPSATEKLNNKMHSARQLYIRAIQLKKDVYKLDDKIEAYGSALTYDIAKKDWLTNEINFIGNFDGDPASLPHLDPRALRK